MSDPIARIRDLAEGMTPQERYYLANAEYLKLRQLILGLTPETLANTQAAFASTEYLSAHPAARNTCEGVSLGAFQSGTVESYARVLKEIEAAGLEERYGFPKPAAA